MTDVDVIQAELRYGDQPRQSLDLYTPTKSKEAADVLLVYVHGGAWRSGDKSEYVDHARDWLTTIPRCAGVAVVNYVISPRKPEDGPAVRHPQHALDVLKALEYLRASAIGVKYERMVLIGHSCGAHLVSVLFLSGPSQFHLSPELAETVKGIIVTEGIYNIDLLLKAHPSYRDFIEGAFGVSQSYGDYSPSTYSLRDDTRHVKWLIVQSAGDSDIREDQAEAIYNPLLALLGSEGVEKDYTSVTQEHFDLLKSPEFRDLILRFSDLRK